MIEIVAGALLGVIFVFLARKARAEAWVYSASLITLPVVYAVFALYAGQNSTAGLEMLLGAPYLVAGTVLTLLALQRSAVLVGLFWLSHGAYDLAHGYVFSTPGVPPWYPVVCAAVDVIVGLYLLTLLRNPPD